MDCEQRSALPCVTHRLHPLPRAGQNPASSEPHTTEQHLGNNYEARDGFQMLLSMKEERSSDAWVCWLPSHLTSSTVPSRKLETLSYKQVALLLLLQHGAHRTLNKAMQDSKQTLPVSKKLHNSVAATSSLSPHLCDKFCIPQAFVKDLILHGAGCPLYL